MTENDPALERASKHVKDLSDFYYHLMTYVFVNILMVAIDLRGGAGAQPVFGLDWAYWIIIGWGFGIVGHAISVFFGDYRVNQLADKERNRNLANG